MPLIDGPIFQTTNPAVGRLLELAITALVKQWRDDGQHNPPSLPFALHVQSELHELAISEPLRETSETSSKLAVRPKAVSQKDRPATMRTYEAAKRLHISVQMVRRYVKADRLTATRTGRAYVIDARSVEALAAEKEHKSA